jgi:hypothetical protein
LNAHGKQMPVKLEFANHSSDEEGDEEEKKESNV